MYVSPFCRYKYWFSKSIFFLGWLIYKNVKTEGKTDKGEVQTEVLGFTEQEQRRTQTTETNHGDGRGREE